MLHASRGNRKRALALFAQGKKKEHVIDYLSKRHPTRTPEEVRKAYFPTGGTFAIQFLEGKPRAEILDRLRKMNAAGARLKKMRADPILAARLKAEASARMIAMMSKQSERDAASARLKAKNKDPVFRAKNQIAAAKGARLFIAKPENNKAYAERGRRMVVALNKDRAVIVARGKKGADGLLRKLKDDPEYAKIHGERSRQVMIKLNAMDPTFAKRASELSTIEIRRLMKEDPEFRRKWAERSSKILIRLRLDPEFRRKMNEGINRYLRIRKLSVIEAKERLSGLPAREYTADGISRGIAAVEDNSVMMNERSHAIDEAIGGLSEYEKQVVYSVFGFENASPLSVAHTAKALLRPDEEINAILKSAMDKLAVNKKLADLVA